MYTRKCLARFRGKIAQSLLKGLMDDVLLQHIEVPKYCKTDLIR
jgi:hypothetical protein